jgi:branched-chain amino acid transport system substrate-binding protein
VRNNLADIKFNSVYGPISFGATGQIDLPQIMIQVQKGQLVPIFDEKGFIQKPIYPMPAWDKR